MAGTRIPALTDTKPGFARGSRKRYGALYAGAGEKECR